MSSQPIDRQGSRRFVCPILLIGALLIAQTVLGQETVVDGVRPHPLIVRPLPGDTPATLARRYLNDASKAWMIEEFNGKVAASPDNALLIPVAPFRRGGLRPDGFQSVPVLVYKDADHRPPDADAAVTEAIRRQLQWLKRNGFTAVTPSQLVDFLNFSGQLPQRSILITADTQSGWFGDGMAPVLREFDFPAIVFVATGHVGAKGAMTWDLLRSLHQNGLAIGCRGDYGGSLARRKPGQSFEAN
ncbi:MAG TPA: hypothetical protein VLT88_00410, partial [Desulfosarcina sp.]|nr:hypothetical protein [Desulfosarcina sp.]